MTEVRLTMLPVPMRAFYTWNEGQRREDYTVLGVGMVPSQTNQCADIYHATRLLVLRTNGQMTWLSIDRLTFEPPK